MRDKEGDSVAYLKHSHFLGMKKYLQLSTQKNQDTMENKISVQYVNELLDYIDIFLIRADKHSDLFDVFSSLPTTAFFMILCY